jgi:hypothetical protein
MRRHVPGLHQVAANGNDALEGVFLVRVDRAFYRWHPHRSLFSLRFAVLEPKSHTGHNLSGRLYCTPRALWKLDWFLRDFGYDPDLLGRDEVDEKALLGLRGIIRTSHTLLNGRCFLNLEAFAPAGEWEEVSVEAIGAPKGEEIADDL